MTVYQGDAYAIPIVVKRGGTAQTPAEITRLEVLFAGLRKTYPGDVIWHGDSGKFLFPLLEAETLALGEDSYDVLVRPLFTDGTIRGWKKAGTISVVAMEGAQTL